MAFNQARGKKTTYLVDRGVLPQTIAVLRARAEPFGIKVEVNSVRRTLGLREGDEGDAALQKDIFGTMVQYPNTRGEIIDWQQVADKTHELGGLLTVATDLLSLTMLKPPGEFGADIAVGNSARFGVPLGAGGPHAAVSVVILPRFRLLKWALCSRGRLAQVWQKILMPTLVARHPTVLQLHGCPQA